MPSPPVTDPIMLDVSEEAAALAGTRFVIIRHGQSGAQERGFISGHDTCTGLSDLGRRQAGLLAERLRRTGELQDASVFATSLLERAQETASIIAPALISGATFEPECSWCEMHPGSVEGLQWAEAIERADLTRLDDPSARRAEGMETWTEVFDRVGTQFRTTALAHAGQSVVVAGHGGTVGSSFFELGGLDARAALDRVVTATNTSITEWRHDGSRWKLERFNDAAHLLGVDW
ncbi:MAG TPA: histidine phosphatase family protein [Acidimicrobiales bacterium]|nr:histidine phosphatase family protein [Acidimicrobiales bacterium]